MKKLALFLLICITLVSCSKKQVKPVSEETKATKEAFALAETIKDAFIKKDLATLEKNSTIDGLRDITSYSKGFDDVEITLTPRWMEIEDNQISLNISWKSRWVVGGKRTEGRGMAVFVMEGSPLKLIKIMRANPFVFPEY
ncbi:MAG: hypothetical protein A2X59_09805 [Nitrospirae bacterium GWC2_42_7]|nr:MAG: hypothetical protein A2X59_09805 [Nitrospirae bacterium GWC2_42_7]